MSRPSQQQGDIKGCLKTLCSLLNALEVPNLTPEILRQAKFNELEDSFLLQHALILIVQASLRPEKQQANVETVVNIVSKMPPRNLLLTFGSIITSTNCLYNLVFKHMQVFDIHSKDRQFHQTLKMCLQSSISKSFPFSANIFSDCALFKNQLKLAENEFLCCLHEVKAVESNAEKLNLNLLKLWSAERRNQSNASMMTQLLKLWLSWQEFIPIFHQWMLSIIQLEIQSLKDERKEIIGAHNLFMPEFTTVVESLKKRCENIRECLNTPHKVENVGPSLSSMVEEVSSSDINFLATKIEFLKQQNRVKLEKLLCQVDKNLLLVS